VVGTGVDTFPDKGFVKNKLFATAWDVIAVTHSYVQLDGA